MTGPQLDGEGLLIHVGYHKTGSSALRQELFRRAELGFVLPWDRDQALRDWVTPLPLDFCAGRVAERYGPGLSEARQDGLTAVLSHERLSGYPASGGYDSKENADRLAAAFPAARILIVIREQGSLLRSWYPQYVRDGGGLSLTRYLKPPELAMIYSPAFRPEFYEFHRLIEHYRLRFSPDRVLALPYELLGTDEAEFVGRIFDFLRKPRRAATIPRRNTGLTPIAVGLRRIANRAFHRSQLNPYPLIDAPALVRGAYEWARRLDRIAPRRLQDRLAREQQATIQAALGDRYHESNRITSELVGMDLREFGYS